MKDPGVCIGHGFVVAVYLPREVPELARYSGSVFYSTAQSKLVATEATFDSAAV